MRLPVLTLLLLSFATFGTGLGRQAITEADEAYYAEASREMADGGDWITPHYNFEDRWQKPVLYYWLTAATYLVVGAGEAAARLWAALSGAGLVLLVWATARRGSTSREHAWLAGAITATCFGYFAMARSALPDLPLAFCITLTVTSVFAAFDATGRTAGRWWWLAGMGIGLGCLLKGPVAVVVPVLAIAPAWWRERRDVTVRPGDLLAAASIAAAIALPWYLAMVQRFGTAYLESFLVGDNLERFATERFNDARPIWFYLPVIAGGLLPWSAFGLAALGPAVVARLQHRWRPSRDELRLLWWAVMPTLFFMASIGQQPRYVLPVLPPLAILIAQAIGSRITGAASGARSATLSVATWSTAAVLVLAAASLYRLRPLLGDTPPAVLTTAIVGVAAAGTALAIVALRRAWGLLPVAATAAAVALLLAVQFSLLAPGRPDAVERMASHVRVQRLTNERVAAYGVFNRNLLFYTGIGQVDVPDQNAAARFFASPERVLLVVPERELPAIAMAAGVTPQRLARVQYFDTADLRLRTVLRPDPEAELETVLLVANR